MSEEQAKPEFGTIDAAGLMLTMHLIYLGLSIDDADTVLIDWDGVMIKSHPCQKFMFNSLLLSYPGEGVPDRIVADFVEKVRWETSEKFPRTAVWIQQGDDVVAEIHNLQPPIGRR